MHLCQGHMALHVFPIISERTASRQREAARVSGAIMEQGSGARGAANPGRRGKGDQLPPCTLLQQKRSGDKMGTIRADTKKGLTEISISPCIHWSQHRDLNSRPADYESAALPTELCWRGKALCRILFHMSSGGVRFFSAFRTTDACRRCAGPCPRSVGCCAVPQGAPSR